MIGWSLGGSLSRFFMSVRIGMFTEPATNPVAYSPVSRTSTTKGFAADNWSFIAAGEIVLQPSGRLEKYLSSTGLMSNVTAGAAVGAVVAAGAAVGATFVGTAVGGTAVGTGVGAGAQATPSRTAKSITLSDAASKNLRMFTVPP